MGLSVAAALIIEGALPLKGLFALIRKHVPIHDEPADTVVVFTAARPQRSMIHWVPEDIDPPELAPLARALSAQLKARSWVIEGCAGVVSQLFAAAFSKSGKRLWSG